MDSENEACCHSPGMKIKYGAKWMQYIFVLTTLKGRLILGKHSFSFIKRSFTENTTRNYRDVSIYLFGCLTIARQYRNDCL